MRRWGRRNAGLYDIWAWLLGIFGYRAMVRTVVRSLPETGIVLDVGCGSGEALAVLRTDRPALAPIGCDLSPEFLLRARKRHPSARLFCGEIEALAVRQGSVDGVLCLGVLGHLLGAGAAIEELARVVRPGGIAAIWTRTDGWASRRVAWLFERTNPGVAFLLHPPAAIRAAIERSGFRVHRAGRVAGGCFWIGVRR